MQQPFKAVVLAGGAGRRLRGLTERFHGVPLPKQFCAFGGSASLLQQTLQRTTQVVAAEDTVVVTGPGQEARARAQLRLHAGVVLLTQPADRGTGTATLLALTRIAADTPDFTVLITPSDHGVRDPTEFARGVATARSAVQNGAAKIVLLGVEADEPNTDFGWIAPGGNLGTGVRRIDAFVEKPPPAEARALHAAGAYWSTMVLVADGTALIRLFRRRRPGLVALLEAVAALPEPMSTIHLRRAYRLATACDLSRDILAETEGLAVHAWSAELGWSDLGTPARMLAWLGPCASA